MKIIYKQGDLLECPETYILHGCNSRGVMGSGVAKGIRGKFPEAYQAYREYYTQHGLSLGELIDAKSNGKVILNGITQGNYGYDGDLYLNYSALSCVIDSVNDYVPEGSRVAMPKIGAGLAGGDWNLIAEIIEERSTRFRPVVYVKE